MGTIKAIFVFLSELTGLTSFLVKRRAARADDPAVQNQNRYEQIDKDIASGNSAVSTLHADNDLDELDRLRNGKNS